MRLSEDIVDFFKRRKIILVSTLDQEGRIHCSVKGLVGIKKRERIMIIDLFHGRTMRNLENNPYISLTAVDEANFVGYTLQGKARIARRLGEHKGYVDRWQRIIVQRISERIVEGVRVGKLSKAGAEAKLPSQPKHLIEVDIEKVIDLAPGGKRRKAQ